MIRYYTREGDPLSPVYAVDDEKKVITLAGSALGTDSAFCWPLRDYLPENFVEVDMAESAQPGVSSFRPKPKEES